ncbi:hypothetical protein AAKU55_005480 [Oxalobacteraceae bacterium GrIS 1.11]
MFKKIASVVAIGLFTTQMAHAAVVESFDSGAWGGGWSNPGAGSVNAGAAHDGAYGVTLDGSSWTYNTSIVFSAGQTLSAWVRPSANSSGRAYFGFSADSAGAESFVAASNTHALIFQDNTAYGYRDQNSAAQTFGNHWNLISITRSADGSTATGKLFAADGSTLLNSVVQSGLGNSATGVALRGFGGFDIDTIPITSAVPEPETYAMLFAGLGLIGFMGRRRKAA